MTAIDVTNDPGVKHARTAADGARANLRAHLAQIDALQRRTWEYEDGCRQANEALTVAERRARQESVTAV